MAQMAGRFYEQAERGVVLDEAAAPSPDLQQSLANEMRKYDALEALDSRYRDLACGASVSNMDAVWVVRNKAQSQLSEHDLRRFEDRAWADFVGKRFTQAGDVQMLGRTMLDIVQSMKLQIQNFVVWGLHPKVEAVETQVVLGLMQKGFLPAEWKTNKPGEWDVRAVAIRLRRSDEFYAQFAMSVGSQLVCNNGHAMGAGGSRYNRDLQYAYRDVAMQGISGALHKHRAELQSILERCDCTDYVRRLSGLRVVVSANPALGEREERQAGGGGVNLSVSNGGGAPAAAAAGGPGLNALDARVAAMERANAAGFVAVQQRFTALVNAHDARFTALDTDMAAHLVRFNALDAAAAAHLVRFNALDAAAAAHLVRLTNLDTAVAAHLVRFNALDTAMAAHLARLANLDTAVAALDAKLNVVNAHIDDPVTGVKRKLDNMGAAMGALDGRVVTLDAALNTHMGVVDAALRKISADITTINGNMTTFNGIINGVHTMLDNRTQKLDGDLSAMGVLVNFMSNKLNTVTATLARMDSLTVERRMDTMSADIRIMFQSINSSLQDLMEAMAPTLPPDPAQPMGGINATARPAPPALTENPAVLYGRYGAAPAGALADVQAAESGVQPARLATDGQVSALAKP